jgi:hypothetical protein
MSTQPTDSGKNAPSNHVARQLGLYSLAAAAAGVGMLALATPASSEVVVTRKTIRIPISNWGKEGVGISFANNGVDDLKLVLSSYAGFGTPFNSLKAVDAAQGKGVVIGSSFPVYGAALAPGTRIGPFNNFQMAACGGGYSCYSAVKLARVYDATSSGAVLGPWAGNHKTAYLGIRFLIDGKRHYGWVRLTVTLAIGRTPSATVTAYAYETEANQPILAGAGEKPTAQIQVPENTQRQAGPSLGLLALGADAMPLWRREETLTPR